MCAKPLSLAAAVLAMILAASAPAAAMEPVPAQVSALSKAADSARLTLKRAGSLATRIVVSLDAHARDAKRVIVHLDRGYDVPGVPAARLCMRNQRVLLEYRF